MAISIYVEVSSATVPVAPAIIPRNAAFNMIFFFRRGIKKFLCVNYVKIYLYASRKDMSIGFVSSIVPDCPVRDITRIWHRFGDPGGKRTELPKWVRLRMPATGLCRYTLKKRRRVASEKKPQTRGETL
jgi:hypothetical protein